MSTHDDKIAQHENKRLIKQNMLETVRENEDMAGFYAKNNCKQCYGRGVLRRQVPDRVDSILGSFQTLRKVKTLCHCVIKNIDKEATSAVEEEETANV